MKSLPVTSLSFKIKTLAAFLMFSVLSCDSVPHSNQTEILWDNYGVPHIYAGSRSEMYRAFGWAQMHNHANLILKLYGQARGRAAEYMGEEYLTSDMKIRLFNVPEQAAKVYTEMNPEFRGYLDAFTKGLNEYATNHPEAIDDKNKPVLPVTSTDVLAHTIRITSLEFVAAEDIVASARSGSAGSNAIAIAPSKSASKKSMLIINPHLPWSDFFTWFEANLNTSGFNVYGICLVGTPSVTMGFNDNLGWAYTVNPLDASDRYELTLAGDGYILDGKTVPFDTKTAVLKIRQKDGTLLDHPVTFKYSMHGPVVAENESKAYAVRIAGFENPAILEEYHRMAEARNFNEFESALKMMQSTMFNVIYADRDGNIFYLFNGNIPVRKTGDFAFWRGTIDGTKSTLIWDSIHPYADLPKILNPDAGFIQNCNDPPWNCTFPSVLKPEDYPPYMAPRGILLRPQRALNMIKDKSSVTFGELTDIKLNTGMESAYRFLDDLIIAVGKYPDSLSLAAVKVLKAWDKKTEVSSRGAVLFANWWDKVRSDMFEIHWDPEHPASTPDGISDPKRAADMLHAAALEVIERYGSLDVPWGEVYRFRMNNMDLPANGGPGEYGIFRTIYFADGGNNKKVAVAGETFVAITEFGDKVRAKVLLSYGNATQKGNKHIGDQLNMLSEKKLREALIYRSDVLENLEETEYLPIGLAGN